jgi:hypothetical protein
MARPEGEHSEAQGKRAALWNFLGALFFYFAAVFMYFYFAHLERTGESVSMNAVVVLMYEWGGKWLVAAVSAGIGTIFLVVGIANLVKGSEQTDEDAADADERPKKRRIRTEE